MFVLIRAVTAVIDFVTQAPPGDALEVVAAEVGRLRAGNLLTDLGQFVRVVPTVVVSVTTPLAGNTDLWDTDSLNR